MNKNNLEHTTRFDVQLKQLERDDLLEELVRVYLKKLERKPWTPTSNTNRTV